MEINLHVCLPELGLTASWVCVKDLLIWTDLGQALHSVTGNNATEAQLKPTTTESSRFQSFCYFLHQHQNYSPIFIPSTNFSYDSSLREREKKIAFTLLSSILQWH